MPIRLRLLPFIAFAALACGDEEQSSNYQVSAVAESDDQTGYATLALPALAQVLVEEDGEPVEGITVNWRTANGGSAASSSVTNADGIAQTVWVLGPSTGTQRLYASVAEDNPERVTLTATALAAVIDFEIVAETDSQETAAGDPLDEQLAAVVTLNGEPTEGIAVEWFTEDGTITDASLSDEDGIARATWTVPEEPGTYHALVLRSAGSTLTFAEFTATVIGPP